MKTILILIAALVLAGCADNLQPMTGEQQVRVMTEYRPTIRAECTGPCFVEYTDPRDRPQLPKNTNAYDVVNTLVGATERTINKAIPYAAGVETIRTVAPLLGDRDSNNTHPTQVVRPEVVQTPAPEVVQLPPPEVIIIDKNTPEPE